MHNSLKNKLIRKATRVSSFISPKHTFFKNSKIISIIKESEIKDIPSINLVKNQEDNKKNKDLIKLIDSSRVKPNLKIHYHKNKKSLYKNNNYNVQYNINNSFNIQNLQKNIFN